MAAVERERLVGRSSTELLGSFGPEARSVPRCPATTARISTWVHDCFVNFGLVALDAALIAIGDDVQIGPGVQLLTPTHPIDPELRRAKWEAAEPISVADNVWLGGGCIVLPGVSHRRGHRGGARGSGDHEPPRRSGGRRQPGPDHPPDGPADMTRAPGTATWQYLAMADERLEVQRLIPAEPHAIFEVLCDPQGHVSIDSSGMLMDATGSGFGDRRHVRRPYGPRGAQRLSDGPLRRDRTITSFRGRPRDRLDDPGQIRPPIGHVYGYLLEPVEGGTQVTSYYDWSNIDPVWREAGIFPVIPESALRATLGILARTVVRAGSASAT